MRSGRFLLIIAKVSSRQAGYRTWWGPVLNVRFDDPDQEPPKQKDCPNATDDLALWQTTDTIAHMSPLPGFERADLPHSR